MLPGDVLVVIDVLFQASVQDPNPSIGKLSNRLTVGLASPSQLVVEARAPGELVIEQKAHWSKASAKRRLRMWRSGGPARGS